MTRLARARGAVGLLLLAQGCASGPQVPDRPLLPQQAFAQRLMQPASGLRVLIQEDHSAPLVAISTVVNVGASGDPAGQEGLAHLVEHLSYRQLGARLKRAGAHFNATTEPERTTYYAIAHRDQTEELLAIEALRLSDPLGGVGNEVLDVERDVVRNEQRQRGGDPRLAGELFSRVWPGGHPMARVPPAGVAPLARVTLASAQGFVAQHYRPANYTVVIAGDIDPAKVGELVAQWPAALLAARADTPAPVTGLPPLPARGEVSAMRANLPRPRSNRLERVALSVPRRRLLVAWPGPPDKMAGDPFLLTTLSGLIIRLAAGDANLSDRAAVDLLTSRAGSVFVVAVRLEPNEDAEQVYRDVLDALGHTRGDAVARMLLGSIKWVTSTRVMRKSSDLLGSSIALAHYLAATGRPSFYRDTLEQLNAVEGLEVSEFLFDIVSRDRAIGLLVEPDRVVGPDGAAGAPADLGIDGQPSKHELEESQVVNLLGMGSGDLLAMVRPPGLGALPRFRLGNGLEVVVVPQARGTAVAEAVVRLPRGDVDMAPFGVASLAATLSVTSCREEDLLFEVGGRAWSRGGEQARQHAVEVFAGNLANGFAALANSLRCRELVRGAQAAAERRVRLRTVAGKELAAKPGRQALESFWRELYPDAAHGLSGRDLPAFGALGEADYVAALRAQYHPTGALAVVVTDLPVTELRPLAEQHLGQWSEPAPPAVRPAPDAVKLPGGRSLRAYQSERPQQAYLRYGCRLPPATEATLPAYDLLEAIIAGEANQVRNSWGATYGFAVAVDRRRRGIAHLVVEGSVEPTRAADAVARLVQFVEKLGSAGPDAKTFTVERWDLGREFNRRFATGWGKAGALLEAAELGFAPTVWDSYPEHLAQLPRAALRELLIPCVGHEVVTVVGDKAALDPALARLARPAASN